MQNVTESLRAVGCKLCKALLWASCSAPKKLPGPLSYLHTCSPTRASPMCHVSRPASGPAPLPAWTWQLWWIKW